MNKVAKEQLGLFKPKKINVPEFNLESRDYLHSVLAQHEQNTFINLGKTMMAAGKGEKTKKILILRSNSGQIFETWSLQNQDLVQAAAHSYGERIVSFSRHYLVESYL